MTGFTRSRGLRDWLVDCCLFVTAVVWGVVLSGVRLEEGAVPDDDGAWLFTLDQLTGVLGCAALWLRRRWPTGLAVALVLLSVFSETIAGAMLVALFSVAVHRPPRTSLAVFGLSLFTAFGYVLLRPEPGTPALLLFLLGAALQGVAVGWGLFVHHRRRLVASLRERAEAEARRAAREEIAREIHDVLGHRLSLLSVHAGALAYRTDASREEVAQAAGVIRESAHQALQDLREVIGMLRSGEEDEGAGADRPQPTLAGVEELVAESADAGMRVRLDDRVGGADAERAPGTLARSAYRIVQEAQTHARKHAPGAEVAVVLEGVREEGLTVEVASGPADGDAPRLPAGSGQGLIGLAERAELTGGRLDYGVRRAEEGRVEFRLEAWLPWSGSG